MLYLLLRDRIGDFHVELERIPPSVSSHKYVSYPIALERAMMEGNYARVYKAAHESAPLPEYNIFLTPLAESVASKAADSLKAGNGSNASNTNTTEVEALQAIEKLLSYAADLERIV